MLSSHRFLFQNETNLDEDFYNFCLKVKLVKSNEMSLVNYSKIVMLE